MKKLLIITGPTATGKSALALECALHLNGEVISADSMQVYQGLNIGTAKLSPSEMRGVKHHMIDIVPPEQPFSVADYQRLAIPIIEDLFAKGKLPIIVGGTGLYIDALLYPMRFAVRNDNKRTELMHELKKHGANHMYEKLKKLDVVAHSKLHPNDTKRVIRAIEIALCGGEKSAHDKEMPRYDSLIIVLSAQRKMLYDRINQRVDDMLQAGLLEEVKTHIGNISVAQSFQAIGYKELAKYLNGDMSYEEAVLLLKKNTRNYAKRQLTWTKRYESAVWFDFAKGIEALRLIKEVFGNDNQR